MHINSSVCAFSMHYYMASSSRESQIPTQYLFVFICNHRELISDKWATSSIYTALT